MKGLFIFLLLATVQICLSAPKFDVDDLKSRIDHVGHGGGVGNGEGSDDDGSSGHGHGLGGNGDNGDDDASEHGGHGDGENGDNGDDDSSSGHGGHGDGGNGENGDDGSSGHGTGHGIPKLPGAPCNDDIRSPVPGVNHLNPAAKVAPGGVGIIGHSGPTLYHINKAKSDAVHGATQAVEATSHLQVKRTSQLALNTADNVVNDARGALDTLGLGPAAETVYGVYTGVSQTAHHITAGAADTIDAADGGLTKGDLM